MKIIDFNLDLWLVQFTGKYIFLRERAIKGLIMCKLYRHPIMQDLDYTWRFEAGTEYVCPIDEDPFQFMFDNKKTTSFSMTLHEYKETIPTLFQTVIDYASNHKKWIQSSEDPNSLWHFIMDESNTFNACHLWNNFQASSTL